jgi:outer membrane biosynthesis protein TonB
MLLLAVVLSLLVHAFGGGLLTWLSRLTHASHPPDDVIADATRITVERQTPPPTATPQPTPRPSSTPTPVPTPTPEPHVSAAPAIPRLATAPRRTPLPRRVAVRPPAPHELARNRPHAPPQPRIASTHGAYTTRQLASMEEQFR